MGVKGAREQPTEVEVIRMFIGRNNLFINCFCSLSKALVAMGIDRSSLNSLQASSFSPKKKKFFGSKTRKSFFMKRSKRDRASVSESEDDSTKNVSPLPGISRAAVHAGPVICPRDRPCCGARRPVICPRDQPFSRAQGPRICRQSSEGIPLFVCPSFL